MSDDKQLYDLFKSNKTDFADNGFSKRVMRRLPERNSRLLPMLIIFTCLLVGVWLTVYLQGGMFVFDGMQHAITLLEHAQIPPVSSLADCLIALLLIGSVSISLSYLTD